MTRHAALLALALAGCALAPSVPPPVVYDLGPAPAAAAAPPLRLRLSDVAAAPALEGNGIAYRLDWRDPFRREVYRDSRWVAPPAALVAQRLRLRLARRACAADAEAPLLQLALDEFGQSFSAPDRSRGVVRLRATLRGAAGVDAERVFEAGVDAASADAHGAVVALANATDAALDELLAWAAQAGAACR